MHYNINTYILYKHCIVYVCHMNITFVTMCVEPATVPTQFTVHTGGQSTKVNTWADVDVMGPMTLLGAQWGSKG